jgi:CheY-like chemotaxis protein
MPPAPLRLLVVEDDHECRLLISSICTSAGYRVEAIADGRMAVSMVQTLAPDLVVLDVQIPGIDGWEVCRTIKRDERTRRIPVLIITGQATPDTYDRTITSGADDFMTKPFRNDRLLKLIATLLADRKP